MNNLLNDAKGIARALQLVLAEQFKYNQVLYARAWDNSSVRSFIEEKTKGCGQKLTSVTQEDISKTMKETVERASMVAHGIKAYATSQSEMKSQNEAVNQSQGDSSSQIPNITKLPKGVSPEDLKVSELDHKDKELIAKLEREYELKLQREAKLQAERKLRQEAKFQGEEKARKEAKIKEERKIKQETENKEKEKLESAALQESDATKEEKEDSQLKGTPVAKKFVLRKQQLDPEAKQRKVPSTRIARMMSFGGLAAGLGIGAIAEATRRTLGFSSSEEKNQSLDQIFLTEANAERIVNTLCKVRGAALKIGQILSIQDNNIISPVLQKAFERVRQSADFMPTWQVHKVLVSELGPDWREKLLHFEEKPFAAASIGQVHQIQLKDGRECAMKIQYPGVAEGIESDINNLVGILKIWNVFPKGLFIDNLVEVAKKELAWEVDYTREAECTKKFKVLLEPYSDYVVPEVIDELSTKQIFTSTLVEGIPVDRCADLDVEHRERIVLLIMQLCLREIFEFQYMQTDPNWSNFFYDANAEKMALLDFGATRSYDKEFIKKYIEVIKAGVDGDKELVLKLSQEMGFLTGYESKNMQDAHVSTVMILAEVFSSEKAFDFGQQDTTARVTKLVPTIVAERLCPPPEEIYSLHRKLSGVFLLCAKLKVKISCRDMFFQVYKKFKEQNI